MKHRGARIQPSHTSAVEGSHRTLAPGISGRERWGNKPPTNLGKSADFVKSLFKHVGRGFFCFCFEPYFLVYLMFVKILRVKV